MRYLFGITFFLLVKIALGQNPHFVREGRVRFERKEDLYAIVKSASDFEEIKKTIPRFAIAHFDLVFSGKRSLLVSAHLPDEAAGNDVVFTDLANHLCVKQRHLFGKSFLLEDSLPNIGWKLTDEHRIIAGYDCRRANAIVMDSIYAVAFYTNDIIPSMGPESFSGLPGMILGVILPHKHISWFATGVTLEDEKDSPISAPVQGEKIRPSDLRKLIIRTTGSGDRFIDNVLTLMLL